MPDLHLGASPGVARERVEHALCPLLTSQNELTLRALRVPAILRLARQGEAGERYARVDDSALEDVGVRAGEDVGHHRT